MMSTTAQRVAFERSEALFERRGVSEIREIEKATLKQIDDKKRKLREIVGESYDDVITSADAIVSMSVKCQAVSDNLAKLRATFSQDALRRSGSQSAASPAPGVTQLDELHALGSRVKYLLDAPELIYSCIDSGDFLEASRRWLKSKIVFTCLQEQAPKSALAKFPILQHMWPNVEKLRGQIVEQVRQHLAKDCRMTAKTAAVCLAALASLEGSDSSEALETFLSSRRSFVANQLENGDEETSLLDLTLVIQNVVFHVGELFCGKLIGSDRTRSESCKLEDVIVAEDVGYTGILFGALSTSDNGAALVEEAAWKVDLEKLKVNMCVLPVQSTAERCTAWLNEVAQLVVENSRVLLGSCKTLQELSLTEKTVNSAVENWNMRKDGLGILDTHGEDDTNVSWAFVVREVLELSICIWDDIFENPFRNQALELVKSSFQNVQLSVSADLDSHLKEIQATPAEPLGAGGPLVWLSVSDFLEKLIDPVSTSSLLRKSSGFDAQMGSDAMHRSRNISTSVDEKILESLQGVVDLLEGSDPLEAQDGMQEQGGTRRSVISLISTSSISVVPKSPRKMFLEPRIRDICEAASVQLCEIFSSKLEELSSAGNSVSVIESALLIGSLSLNMADSSGALPVFMGAPDQWKSHVLASGTPLHSARAPSSAFFTPRSARSKADHNPIELWPLKEKFRSVGLKGYQLWASWAARGLANEVTTSWSTSEVLTQKEALQSWEEIVISSGDEGGEPGDEMRFFLPSCPSGEMMTCLLASSRELQRVGGHNAISEALQLFEWELGSHVCDSLGRFLKDDSLLGERLGEVGTLQLLLDMRLLRDVLSGGLPLSSLTNQSHKTIEPERTERRQKSISRLSSRGSGVLGGAVDHSVVWGERKKMFSSVESALSERLDPIDWATYEPHLWVIGDRFYHRSSVIFGVLMQLNPASSGASVKLPPSAETNLMNLVPVVPRFQYLPVRAPLSQKRDASSLTTQSVVDAMTNTSLPTDPTGNYSFSELGVQKRDTGQTTGQQESGTSTFSGFQAKLGTASLGTLSSMIGDKAAEVSALAQQQFGDLASGVGTSWLTNLSFKGMARPEQSDNIQKGI